MTTVKACQISDESLLKCMKDYLENPTKFHPAYLELLTMDYSRRVKERIEYHGGKEAVPPSTRPPRTAVCSNMTNITT
jgi:hypothetical protein